MTLPAQTALAAEPTPTAAAAPAADQKEAQAPAAAQGTEPNAGPTAAPAPAASNTAATQSATQVPAPPASPEQSDTQAENAATAQNTAAQLALEAEFATALEDTGNEATASTTARAPSRNGATLALLDLSLGLLGAVGGSTVAEEQQRALEGGGHDPSGRGFTIQNVELTFAGVVDPYLRGDASIVMQLDAEGESTLELEEVYLTTLDLPLNLQLKAGHFFGAFGRQNASHPHSWDFVDTTVINSRLLGPDGFRNPGAQLSWLTPLPFFAEVLASVHNAQGETAFSFRSVAGEQFAGRTLLDRGVGSLADLVYLLRLRTSFDLGDEVSIVPAASALLGPNATGSDTHTQVYGADLYVKWKPLSTDRGWPYVTWQSEGMARRYLAAEVRDEAELIATRESLLDWGLYSQLVWGFMRPFSVGLRYDYARGENHTFSGAGMSYSSASDPLRDERQRASGAVTYYPSEFSKVRLQYNFDHAQFLSEGAAHSVYLQAEILLGAHGAHKF